MVHSADEEAAYFFAMDDVAPNFQLSMNKKISKIEKLTSR